MDCTFQGSAIKVDAPKPAISARDSPFDNYDALSTSTIQMPGTILSPSYAHGYCSFKMQLMQQCLHNPSENWHNEILGNLFSIEDADRKTVVAFPEGAGRIDGQIKRLTGMGDGLYITYHTNSQVYFRYDGALWDTTTKDDGKAQGLCHWGPWSRGEWGCEERFGWSRRTSDIACVFKC